MSVLTLDVGGANLTVPCQKGGHADPRRVGTKPVSFAGGQTSSVRAELMVVPVILAPRTATEAAQIRALFALGAWVPCQGDVFNNASAVITCSGTFSDEIDQTATWWTMNLTLFEVGTTLGYTSGGTVVILTGTTSPDDPGAKGAIPQAAWPGVLVGDTWACMDLMTGVAPITCGGSPDPGVNCPSVYSPTPEIEWLTVPLVAGWLTGTPRVYIRSEGGTGDRWYRQHVQARIYVVRSGLDVAGPFATDYQAGYFSAQTITLTSMTSIVFELEDNDRIRVELWAEIALHGGYTDDSVRQEVCWGYLGGGVHLATLVVGSLVTAL